MNTDQNPMNAASSPDLVPITCRPMVAADFPAVMAHFGRTRPEFAQMTSTAIHRAVSRDALSGSDVLIVVAASPSEIVGHSVAIIHWFGYWKRFVFRHPLLGSRILGKRALRGMTRHDPAPEVYADQAGVELKGHGDRRVWSESDATIAKILHVGVEEVARKRGVGRALYEETLRALAVRKVRRLDAHVDRGNLASLRLHATTGWTIAAWHGGYFASIDIDTSQS